MANVLRQAEAAAGEQVGVQRFGHQEDGARDGSPGGFLIAIQGDRPGWAADDVASIMIQVGGFTPPWAA
jgi:hypothetical protein